MIAILFLLIKLYAAFFLLIIIGYVVVAFLGGTLGFLSRDSENKYLKEDSEAKIRKKTYPRLPFDIKTWEERKEEYRQGKTPGWFDKINLWIDGK